MKSCIIDVECKINTGAEFESDSVLDLESLLEDELKTQMDGTYWLIDDFEFLGTSRVYSDLEEKTVEFDVKVHFKDENTSYNFKQPSSEDERDFLDKAEKALREFLPMFADKVTGAFYETKHFDLLPFGHLVACYGDSIYIKFETHAKETVIENTRTTVSMTSEAESLAMDMWADFVE